MHTKAELLDELIASLRDDPAAWAWGNSQDTHPSHIVHATGVRLWIWNGAAKLWQPREVHFGFFGKRRLRKAFNQWRRVYGRDCLTDLDRAAIDRVVTSLRSYRSPAFRKAA